MCNGLIIFGGYSENVPQNLKYIQVVYVILLLTKYFKARSSRHSNNFHFSKIEENETLIVDCHCSKQFEVKLETEINFNSSKRLERDGIISHTIDGTREIELCCTCDDSNHDAGNVTKYHIEGEAHVEQRRISFSFLNYFPFLNNNDFPH